MPPCYFQSPISHQEKSCLSVKRRVQVISQSKVNIEAVIGERYPFFAEGHGSKTERTDSQSRVAEQDIVVQGCQGRVD